MKPPPVFSTPFMSSSPKLLNPATIATLASYIHKKESNVCLMISSGYVCFMAQDFNSLSLPAMF